MDKRATETDKKICEKNPTIFNKQASTPLTKPLRSKRPIVLLIMVSAAILHSFTIADE